MFEGNIRYRDDELVGRLTISLNDDRAIFAFCLLEQWAETLNRSFLIAKIDRWHRAAADADDLRIPLRAEQERRRRRRNRNSGLQNKVRAEEREENQEKYDVDQRENDKPAEVIFLCSAKFHADQKDCRSNGRDELLARMGKSQPFAGN